MKRGSSVAEDHRVQPAETLGVGENVDSDDLPGEINPKSRT